MGRTSFVQEFLVEAVNPLHVKRRVRALRAELAQLEELFPSVVNGTRPVARQNGSVKRVTKRRRRVVASSRIGNPNRASGLAIKVLDLMPRGGALVTAEQVVPLLEAQGYPFMHNDAASRKSVVRATLSRLIAKGLVHKADKGQYRRL